MDKLQSPIAKVSWPFLFGDGDPEAESESKYTICLMLPKGKEQLASLTNNPVQQKKILDSVNAFVKTVKEGAMVLAKAKWKDKYKSKRWNPIIDGDTKADEGGWEGYKGFWIVRAKSKFKPKIKGPKGDEYIQDGDDDPTSGFYPGCWARAFITAFTYSRNKNEGVAFSLGTVQKCYNDEVLEGTGEEFDGDVMELDDDEFENSEEKDEIDDLT